MVPEGGGAADAKLFDINMLVVLGGLERTTAEYRRLLEDTGFELSRVIPTQAPLSILEAIPRPSTALTSGTIASLRTVVYPADREREEIDMSVVRIVAWVVCSLIVALTARPGSAADYPAPKEGSWVVRDFRFHTGEVLPELRLHYTTVGAPTGEPVLILHGTTGSGTGLLTPAFAGELFGSGQPLDASRYYVILPDAIGTGKSSKPSDGLRTAFPKYNYDDMVHAQYRLVTEHLGVRHLRLVLGNSMGGMQTWMWAQKYPDFMDVAVPMASLPTEMSGRNWMMRRLIIDAIRNDPEWMNGNYTTQPRSLQFASVFYGIGTSGGNQRLQDAAPTREKADQLLNQRLSAPFRGDANDHLYQWEASRDYNAAGDSSASRPSCWRSTPRTTSATHRSSGCWSVRSRASRRVGCC